MSESSAARAPVPSAHSFGHQIGILAELWLDALFLKPAAYFYQRDRKNPFGHGLLYIVIIGVIVALAGIIGALLRYATTPSADAIKNTILVHLQAMPFYASFDPVTQQAFEQGYQQVWNQFGSVFVGYPADAAGLVTLGLSLLTTPLGFVIGWLIYGALVHLIGHRWNAETSYAELLGPLALAYSPQVLNVLNLFPNVGVSGVVISLWMFICNVFAIRVAYNTTTGRAIWGAVFPTVLLLVIVFALGVCGVIAFGSTLARGGGQ